MSANQQIILYGTQGCHLCDKAERVVRRLAPAYSLQFVYCDIAGDDQLMQRFALQIPVLEHSASGAQLSWPIDDDTFVAFVAHLPG